MQRNSFTQQSYCNNDVKQSSFQRGLNYVKCHDNYPLQLKGNMKKHSKLNNKDQIKGIINYESSNVQMKKNNKVGNCHNGQIGQSNALAQRILSNHKMSKENYQKSIVPSDDMRSQKQRPQSVKTYKENRSGSGINYLLSTNEKNLYKKPQKRHVEEYHIPKRQSFGRKCNISAQKHTESSQIISCMDESRSKIVSTPITNENIQINSATFGVIHSSTTNKRISYDIYSSYANKETIDPNIPAKAKNESRNQFKTGIQLGYEFKKSKQIASKKINEMMGNESYWKKTNQTESLRQKRDDWRRSAFVIQ